VFRIWGCCGPVQGVVAIRRFFTGYWLLSYVIFLGTDGPQITNFLYVPTIALLEEQSTTTELTDADANAVLPAAGKEFAALNKFNIDWVRSALAALEIAVGDKNDLGERKAALSTYYIKLNAAKSDLNAATSEVEEVGGRPTKSTANDNAIFWALRDRGVLLKNAPSPQKDAGLHLKAHPKPGLAFLTDSSKSLKP